MLRTVTHSCGHRWSYDCGPASDRLTEDGKRKQAYVQYLRRGRCPQCLGISPLLPAHPARELGEPDFVCRR